MRLPLVSAALGISMLAIGLLALLPLTGASADTKAVNVGNYYFCDNAFQGSVCETAVNAGDTVTWTLEQDTHTVTQCDQNYAVCPPSGGFDGGTLNQGQSFSHTFASAGTYYYHCDIHPSEMMGRIVVAALQATASPTPTAAPTGSAAPTAALTAAASIPRSGGPPAEGGASLLSILLLAAGGALVVGSGGLVFAQIRRKS